MIKMIKKIKLIDDGEIAKGMFEMREICSRKSS
jgi:hypothetical protein